MRPHVLRPEPTRRFSSRRPPALLRAIYEKAANCGAVVLLALSVVAPGRPAVAAQSYPDLFGTRELHSENLTMFPKWRGMLDRYAAERRTCQAGPCKDYGWGALVDGERGKDLPTQLREINGAMNHRPYVSDLANWHVQDYWATPLEFMARGGDCEDYAIAKYMALRELGFPVDDMRVVVLNDLNLGVAHAILVVYVKGTALVLDNRISTVIPADAIRHYRPVYSINEHGWWLHRSETGNIAANDTSNPAVTAAR